MVGFAVWILMIPWASTMRWADQIPIRDWKSIRILLAIAAFYDYEIWQMDIKTAFLNDDLEEELYVVQSSGFEDSSSARKVCKLKKSIYGFKQAFWNWNLWFDHEIKKFDFKKYEEESCVYKKVSGSLVVCLVPCIDDILLISYDVSMIRGVVCSSLCVGNQSLWL